MFHPNNVSLAGALNNATHDLKAASRCNVKQCARNGIPGLDSLAKGNADEIIALAELDAVKIPSKSIFRRHWTRSNG